MYVRLVHLWGARAKHAVIMRIPCLANGQNIRIHLFARGYGELFMQRACDWHSMFMYNVN